jgi:glycosyltransferase involved in cell wall biosynthesis
MIVVRRQVPKARLRFVGPIRGRDRKQLAELAGQVGVADAIEFVESGDDSRLAAARLKTMVAVQLQPPDAAAVAEVAELLSCGVPTVVGELGPLAELPDDVVVKVDSIEAAPHLGEVLSELLADREARAALSGAATGYAKANSFSRAAEALAELLFS